MYCMATKKNPKLAKKRIVMPIDSGGEVGSGEQPDVEQGMSASQFHHRECDRERDTRQPCSPTRSDASSPRGRFDDAEYENRDAPSRSARRRRQSIGVAVSSRDDRIVNVRMNRATPDAVNA